MKLDCICECLHVYYIPMWTLLHWN